MISFNDDDEDDTSKHTEGDTDRHVGTHTTHTDTDTQRLVNCTTAWAIAQVLNAMCANTRAPSHRRRIELTGNSPFGRIRPLSEGSTRRKRVCVYVGIDNQTAVLASG